MGFSNQPKILRGAFVEFGVSEPPLIVVFQFNPLTITRMLAAAPMKPQVPAAQGTRNLKAVSKPKTKPGLFDFRPAGQTIQISQETLSFDIRLDATDKLNDGDAITEQFGVSPQLSTLELMMAPKGSSLLESAKDSFSFKDEAKNPPVILFIWGRKKVMPVNIKNMTIKEEEFSIDLNPTRATITVSLEVIEGPNAPFLYTKARREAMSLLNLANIGDVANTVVPK